MKNRLLAVLTTAVLLLAILSPPPARAQTVNQQLAAGSVLETIKKRGSIRVGMSTFVPWAMRDKNGELIGYEIDVAKQLAEDMKIKVEFVPTAWDGIVPALLAGKFDVVIGGMTITPERNLTVNFTQPYANSGTHLVANKELAAGFKSLEDFNKPDVVLAVRRGATPATAAKRLMPKA
ncbi:MAG: transporter substrate-binding domain-containing protein, partial [Candidatus Contendobacter sp.]|nr:transporter substrate-binding domain-containing protein [Candidatus Contendobacter sp.]